MKFLLLYITPPQWENKVVDELTVSLWWKIIMFSPEIFAFFSLLLSPVCLLLPNHVCRKWTVPSLSSAFSVTSRLRQKILMRRNHYALKGCSLVLLVSLFQGFIFIFILLTCFYCFVYLFVGWEKMFPCGLGRPWAHRDPPASACQTLGLKAWTTMVGSLLLFLVMCSMRGPLYVPAVAYMVSRYQIA